jgi:hypothetical protein
MRRERLAFLLLLLSMPLALAQHWDVEKVDSAGWGRDVHIQWHPDGRLFLCYQDTFGRIRLAFKDSVWSYDSLAGTSGYYGLGFSISKQGSVGVSWLNPDYPWQVILASKSGASWRYDSTGLTVTGPGPALLAYDTAGNPTVMYTCTDGGCTVVRARRVDSLWNAETILGGGGWSPTLYCYEYLISRRDSASLLYVFADAFPQSGLARPWFYQDLLVARESAGSWVETGKAYAWYSMLGALSMALDSMGAPQACWRDTIPTFRYEGAAIGSQACASSIVIDQLNRPCIAYTRPELMFTYRDNASQWWSSIVSHATSSESQVSIALDQGGEPLIAYSTPDGLWLAHGEEILGQSEEKPTACDSQLAATVVRNVLRTPVSPSSVHTSLYDMTGRRVAELHSGANDVSVLTPGVYFVQEARRQAVRKVVITR